MGEVQLILSLARASFSGVLRAKAAALLTKPLNWTLILERATAEEVYPLFFRNLERLLGKEHGAGSRAPDVRREGLGVKGDTANAINAECKRQHMAPGSMLRAPCDVGEGSMKEAREKLRRLAKINAFRAAILTEELARVLKLFAKGGIPAIPLKGPALAQALYGDPSLRTSVDLDILVPRSMVQRAFNLLRADGYKSEFGPGFFANLLLRHNIEYALRRCERGFDYIVELHWGVLWGGKAEKNIAERLWADPNPATVFDAPAYALSIEWQILVLAAHAARHQWQGLKWLVDLHELCSSPDVDWDKLDRKAKLLGWHELLRISFLACCSLFDTAVPQKYLVGELPAWVNLFPAVAPVHLNGAFFPTRLIQKPLDKIRYAGRVLLIPTLAELRFVTLPSLLAFLYYPLRPLRLGFKWRGFLARSRKRGVFWASLLGVRWWVLDIGFQVSGWDWLTDLAQ